MIEPALTAEEWAARAVYAGDQSPHHPSYVDLHEKDGYLWADAGDALDFYGQGAGRVGNRHGVAALCLYGQPFGFTRDDVALVRWFLDPPLLGPNATDEVRADLLAIQRERIDDLADRIEALLPPEDVDG